MAWILSRDIYVVSVSVRVSTGTMHGHDVVVDTCLVYDLIARKSLPLGWEQCIVKDSKIPSLARVDDIPLSLSNVVSLAIGFGSTACCAHFVIADRLAGDAWGGVRFLKAQLKTVEFARDVLVFKRGAVVSVLSSLTQNGDGTPCSTQSASSSAPSRAQKRDTITDGYETHAARMTRQLHIPAMTQGTVLVHRSE